MSHAKTFLGGAVAAILVAGAPGAAAQEVSKIRVGSLTADTSTTTANSFYPVSTTSTREFWGPDPMLNRPVELKELARALHNNVDLIYEYVHDNVRTEFMYGLKKGALGAMIDQSGTPFDQAHLMVELLREAGYSARYKAGTLLLNATQMNAWLGSNNSTAVRSILRNGGIPLNYSSTGPTYTIGHIWVEVTIPGATCGSTCWFDPSYKTHLFKPTLNLETLMGWSGTEFSTTNSAGFLGNAWSTLQQQTTPAVPVWVSNVNYEASLTSGIAPKLKTYATNLAAQLQSATYAASEIEDVVGGQDIIKVGALAVRNSSLPGFTTSVQRTWDCASSADCGIPDAYRSQLTLKMLDQANPTTNPPLINKTFFADEIYGRRLYFDLPMALSLPDDPGATAKTLEPWCVKLTLDDVPVAGGTVGCAGQTTPVPNLRVHLLRMEVNNPYAAGTPAGSYMDLSTAQSTQIDKRVDFGLPVVVIHGWGDTSAALLSKLSAEQRTDRMLPVVDKYNPEQYEPSSSRGNTAMDHTMQKLGLSYLAQYSAMANIQKRLGGAEHQQHYAVGVLYGVAMIQNGWPPANAGATTHEWSVVDRSIRINIDSAISVTSKTNVAADRSKVIHSTLAAAAELEGSIFEQNLDQLYVGSTATRFQWGNANLANKYYLFRTMPTATDYQNLYSTTSGCAPGVGNAAYSGLSSYVNATEGFWAIAAAEGCLGPGNKYSTTKVNTSTWYPSKERGAAFVAWRPDDAAVAHVITYSDYTHNVSFKGGGAAVRPEYAQEFDATGAAGLLKDKFEDRSSMHGVNLQTGDINFSPAADISIGEGGFPYELSFQRSFAAGGAKSPGLSNGWGHNLDIRAATSGDGLAKMGNTSAALAAESIAAIYTMQKIYSVAPAPASNPTATQQRDHLKRWVLAPFVANWWGTRLTNNVVTITQGRATQQYTRLIDLDNNESNDTFKPPRNGTGTLAQTGVRIPKLCSGCSSPPAPDDIKTQWDYSGVAFSYTSVSKEAQSFGYYEFKNNFDPLAGNPEELAGEKHGWHLNSWTFPFGVSLSFVYDFPPPGSGGYGTDKLISVSNNLGRTLTLNYSSTFDGTRLDSITDGQSRTVQFGFDTNGDPNPVTGLLTSVTNTEGEISRYQYLGAGFNVGSVTAGSRPLTDPKLWKVFAPSDATNEKTRIDYDRTWKVKELRDAIAVLAPAQRNPYQFFITGTNRGERLSPIHGLPDSNMWTVYYDIRGRSIQIQDEEGRAYNQIPDNHDRVKERTYPEGNKVQFAYDDPTQQIKSITQVAKSSTSSTYWSGALPNITIAASYDPGCGKIKTVTDAKLKVTTWNYNATTCTLTNVQQPQVPDPQNGNTLTTPTTSFLYNSLGQFTQVTDPTNRVVSVEYDPTSKYRLRRRVDPSGLNLITTYGHDAYGDVNSVDGPRSDVSDVAIVQYDKQRRVKRVDSPLAQITRNCYDLDGDVISVHRNKSTSASPPDTNCASAYDANFWQSWFNTYTATKKPYQATSPTGAVTSTFYDGLDRVDYVQDPDGRKVKTEYFRDGKTKKITKAYQSVTMAPIVYATYTLTPNGQIDTVADGNQNLTNIDYDGYDRPFRTFFSDPASGAPCAPALPHSATAPSCSAGQTYEQVTYDANGNVTSKRNRSGVSIAFAFDDLNREATRTVPNNALGHFARTLTTRYDLASRKWDLIADGQTTTNFYDTAARLDYVTDSWIGFNNTIDYGYDVAGNRTSMAWPGGGSLTYTYDALNRMDTVTDSGGVQLADYDWDALSRKDFVRQNNASLTTDYGFEADDDLNLIAHSAPLALSFTLGRNASSQITSLAASDGAFLSRPTVTKSDTYVPNRLNQIATVNGASLGYDANGNLTSDGTFTFEYDEENRLRSAVGNGHTVSYEYDPLGRRRAKTDNDVITKFISDGVEEIEERDGSNNLLRRYAYGPGVDERIAILDTSMCTGGGRCFFRTNWQGSTTHLINQDGLIHDTYHYGPYGERIDWTPTDPDTGNPFRYTGRRYDPETGLYYYRARYYSPKLGRFLQTDPTGSDSDLNLYRYADNNPLNVIDPTGLSDVNLHSKQLNPQLFNFRAYADSFNTENFDFSAHGMGSPMDSREYPEGGHGPHLSVEQTYELMVGAGYKQGQTALFNACHLSGIWMAQLAKLTHGRIIFQENFPYQGHGKSSNELEVRGSTTYPIENDKTKGGIPALWSVAIPLGDGRVRIESAGFTTIVVDLKTGEATYRTERTGSRVVITRTYCVEADKCGPK